MADILIRGMEMPGHCIDCPLMVDRFDTDACALQSQEANEAFESWDDMRRGCPLVPLPKGHGRLGDLDALQEEFKKSHDGKRLMLIDTAPTTIEADLEWKMKNCCCFSNTDRAEGGSEDAPTSD